MEISNIYHKFILARWMYSIGKPIIEDPEYNFLLKVISDMGTLKEYTDRTWSDDPCPVRLLKQYGLEKHAVAIVHSDKTESIPSITNEYEILAMYVKSVSSYILSYKYDGFNIQLTYHNGKLVHAQTRGRTGDFRDVYEVLSKVVPLEIEAKGKVRIIGEGVLSDNDFFKLKQVKSEASSQRSSVSTVLADVKYAELLTFMSFKIVSDDIEFDDYEDKLLQLRDWGFTVIKYWKVSMGNAVLNTTHLISREAIRYIYPTDGVVVANNDVEGDLRALRIGFWEEKIHHSYIEGLEETVKGHRININLRIRPVQLSNSRHTEVTITNLDRVMQHKLFPGSPIAFVLRSHATAVPDLPQTKTLQSLYNGDFDSFRKSIDEREELVASKKRMFSNAHG